MSLAMYASPYENENDDITHSKKQVVTNNNNNNKNLRKTVKKPVTNKVANFMKKLQQHDNEIDVDDGLSPLEEEDEHNNLADYNNENNNDHDNDNHHNNKVVDNYSTQMPIMPFYNSNIDSSAPVAAAVRATHVPVPESDELMQKLNHIIELLEKQEHEKSDSVAEELILYCFLGIFVIFIVDSFARAGKYVR